MRGLELWFRDLVASDSTDQTFGPRGNDFDSICLVNNGGGLFLDSTLPSSFISFVPRKVCSSADATGISHPSLSCSLKLRGYGVKWNGRSSGNGFLSVSLSIKGNGQGHAEEQDEVLGGAKVSDGNRDDEIVLVDVKKEEDSGLRQPGAGKGTVFNTTKHLWAGAIAAMVSRTFVAPLERLKLEYIVRGEQKHLFELIKTIGASQGLKGFWKGNFVNILRTAPFKAINFYAYDTYRNNLLKVTGNEETTNFERFIAGAAAGITATVLCIPMDTIRTKMVAPGGEALGGVIGTFRHMIETEGFFSLYKGLVPSIISMAPSGAVFYGVYDILKSAYLHSPEGKKRLDHMSQQGEELNVFEQLELGPVRTLIYGAIAGACAEASTYPFEVVRRQLQMQVRETQMSSLATFVKIVEQGGVPALYAGVVPSLLQVLPSAAISYFVYEFMKIVMKVE
ncbi:probable mitochondrial adenine nucleotide transporter BTL3 [Impatiens glandulifera]|uniref:probable mitochondrial adenine nucleotide transporter BTL3 n=1 Tax=Impatiens glandulifera TaxID=253017 RepID=UPI001FB0F154|nr:probable mitochondrial adenine nucleotide transporter BTL3 [Impatiens glandulifera]